MPCQRSMRVPKSVSQVDCCTWRNIEMSLGPFENPRLILCASGGCILVEGLTLSLNHRATPLDYG